MNHIELQWTTSLDKVFLAEKHEFSPYFQASALQGEVFSLQLAYKSDIPLQPLDIEVISPLADFVQCRQVCSIAADFFGEKHDDFILSDQIGLYPDLLSDPARYRSVPGVWHALWVTIRLPQETAAGKYPLQLKLTHRNPYRNDRDADAVSPVFDLEVLPVHLPEPDIKVTNWFYGDCLYRLYNVEPWSEKFFALLKNYFLNMRAHGQNMIYVPLFTPPLDTYIGSERPTMQSVTVFEHPPMQWKFDFSLMKRYIGLALECGMEYLEFSHLFTQWGAEYTPKIMVTCPDGSAVRRFGWDVRAESDLYRRFLETMLPELQKVLAENHWMEISYFHISDEPYERNKDAYAYASKLFHTVFPECRFLDALSRTEFFSNGMVDIPVPANNHIEEFAALDLPERWTYYCVSQWDKVPNQFTHLPSVRNRIFGILAYIYDLDGFLHWGYNFWFGQYSMFEVDPYHDSCAGHGFPPGDAFKVYPGKDGQPEDSIRHEVFFEALQDLAALQLLECRISREDILNFIRQQWDGKLPAMDDYPRSSKWLQDFRNELNKLLVETKNVR